MFYFTRNFERQKKIYNADADTDVNADADAQMLMPKFPNGHFCLMFFMGQKQPPEACCKKGCS